MENQIVAKASVIKEHRRKRSEMSAGVEIIALRTREVFVMSNYKLLKESPKLYNKAA
jgi:hypothetical protein